MSSTEDRSPWFTVVVFAGGLVFGLGLAIGEMTHPEVVLSFLRLEDFGLLVLMGAGVLVTAAVIAIASRSGHRAPFSGTEYGRRVRSMDRNVLVGGSVFGVGWGLSGICPGAAYASVGIGNYPILIGIVGMFAGAYLQAYWRSYRASGRREPLAAD